MNQTFAFILVALIAFAGGGLFTHYFLDNTTGEATSATSTVNGSETVPTFSWRFVEADTNNPDGFPQTTIFLATGITDERHIDTVDGDCSILQNTETPQKGVAPIVQCYYAGLGQRYRVMQSANGYVVERKLFEESLPDVIPLVYEWERVEEIALK